MATKRKKAKARGSFSPSVKARLFEWDRAVCAFSGASLWVLDYGACSLFHEDWMDHVRPAARGGTHDVTNGICASGIANWVKGANGRANLYWFVGGRPTCHFYDAVGRVPSDIARRLRRDVRSRDWYLNHCFRNLLWRVNNLATRSRDRRHTRTPGYYVDAAFGFLQDYTRVWAKETKREYTAKAALSELRARQMVPREPRADQHRMLDVLAVTSPTEIERIARDLVECYNANDRWLMKMDQWTNRCDPENGRTIVLDVNADKEVSPMVRNLVIHNIRVLSGLPATARGQGKREIAQRW